MAPKRQQKSHAAHRAAPDPDLYAELGLARNASVEDIKRAYRRLALQCHPDKCPGDQSAHERFQRISLAYSVLSDEQKRRYYDQTGTTEGLDISPDEFMDMFQSLLLEIIGGADMIRDMLSCFTPRELARLPPFPFPKELFPPGTFPPGLRFSTRGMKGMPPQVEELINNGDLMAMLAAMAGPQPRHTHHHGRKPPPGGRASASAPRRQAAAAAFGGAGVVDEEEEDDDDDEYGNSSDSSSEWTDVSDEELEELLSTGAPKDTATPSTGAPQHSSKFETVSEPAPTQPSSSVRSSHSKPSSQPAKQPIKTSVPSAAAPCPDDPNRNPTRSNPMVPSCPVMGPAAAPDAAMVRAWINAARCCDVGAMAVLLERQPALLSSRGAGLGHTALHWCAAKGSVEGVKWLLAQGQDVNVRNDDGATPLHAAARNGQLEAVEALLGWRRHAADGGFNGTVGGSSGSSGARSSPDYQASSGTWGPASCDLTAVDGEGRTALQLALQYKHLQVAERLQRAAAAVAAEQPVAQVAASVTGQDVKAEIASGKRVAEDGRCERGKGPGGRKGASSGPEAESAGAGHETMAAEGLTDSRSGQGDTFLGSDRAATPEAQGVTTGRREEQLADAGADGAQLVQAATPVGVVLGGQGRGVQGGGGGRESAHSSSSCGSGVLSSMASTAPSVPCMMEEQPDQQQGLQQLAGAGASVIAAAAAPTVALTSYDVDCGLPGMPAILILQLAREEQQQQAGVAGCGAAPCSGPGEGITAAGGVQGCGAVCVEGEGGEEAAEGITGGRSRHVADNSSAEGVIEPHVGGSSSAGEEGGGGSPSGGQEDGEVRLLVIASEPEAEKLQQPDSVKAAPQTPLPPLQPRQQPPPSSQSWQPDKQRPAAAAPAAEVQPQPNPVRRSGLTAAERAVRRAALLAADEAAEAAAERREAAKTAAAEAAALAAGLSSRSEGRMWLEAARAGNLATLQRMLEANPRLLGYQGQGTSFAFTSHTALHWAAAGGHTTAVRWLLTQGAQPGAINAAGATPLHAAASHGAAEVARVLVLQAGASMGVPDALGETPRDILLRRDAGGGKGGSSTGDTGGSERALRLANELEMLSRLVALRDAAGGVAEWSLRAMRSVLAAAGVNVAGLLERRELVEACRELIAKYPPRISTTPVTSLPAPAPAATPAAAATTRCTPAASSTPAPAPAAAPSASTVSQEQPQVSPSPPPPPPPDVSAASASTPSTAAGAAAAERCSTQEAGASADTAAPSAVEAAVSAAKQRGNEAFARGDHPKAVSHYTMALRLCTTPNAVLYSNRSAAYSSMSYYGKAQADAEEAVRLDPGQPKYRCRLGVSLLGQRHWREAEAAFRSALQLDPSYAAAVQGLKDVRAAMAQSADL